MRKYLHTCVCVCVVCMCVRVCGVWCGMVCVWCGVCVVWSVVWSVVWCVCVLSVRLDAVHDQKRPWTTSKQTIQCSSLQPHFLTPVSATAVAVFLWTSFPNLHRKNMSHISYVPSVPILLDHTPCLSLDDTIRDIHFTTQGR